MGPWWILPNISEVSIESDKDPILGVADFGDFWIRRTAKRLFFNGQRIVTLCHHQLDHFDREVLVGLEPHGWLQPGKAITRSRARSAA